MFPDRHEPTKPAYVMARAGTVVTYGELTERSQRAARLMRDPRRRARRHGGDPAREPPAAVRADLGRAAGRAALHGDLRAADRRRGRLHPRGLRREGAVREPGDDGGRAGGGARAGDRRRDRLRGRVRRRAARRRGRGRRVPLLVGHDRSAEGDQVRAAVRPDRHAARAHRALPAALWLQRRHGLPVARAAVPLGTAAVHHGRPPPRRHDGDHGALRRARAAGAGRAPSRHAHPDGADDVRAAAAPDLGGARPATTSRRCGRSCTRRRPARSRSRRR